MIKGKNSKLFSWGNGKDAIYTSLENYTYIKTP